MQVQPLERKIGDDVLALADIITNALQASDIGIAVYDRQLELLSFNPAYARVHGFRSGQSCRGRLMHDILARSPLRRRPSADENRPGEREDLARLIRNGSDHVFYTDASGAPVRVSRHLRPSDLIVETIEHPVVEEGNNADVNRERGKSHAIGRERLAQALENMADGFALFDRDGFLVAINERYRELSPYLAPVLQIGVAHDDVIRTVYRSGEVEIEGYTEDEFVAFANRQRLSSTQASFHRTKEGRWMRYAPRRLDDGSTLFLQSDVTEMKAHEERAEATDRQLVRRTNEFETAMSSMPDGFILFDAKGNMIACNQRYREMLGLPDEILVPGVSRARLMDVARDTGLFAQAHVQEASDAYEVSLRRSDPHTFLYTMADGRVLQMRFTPIKSGGSAVLVIDRTAELEAEEKLQRYSRQLERSNSELQNFAYVASHDLQEPLRKIEAFGDRLSKKYAESLPEGGQHYLERILDASGRMRQLINDLLSFSRVSARPHKPDLTDLADVLRDVTNDIEMRLEETGATIEAADLPSIEADATLMRQLFQNLIANSIKFARKDVAPVIRIETERHSGIQSGGLLLDEVELRFSDNGIGFDNRFNDQIFTIFQRLHGRSEYEGTGIGLATCRRIVERHHGTIAADGIPGEGATFTIRLPAAQPEVESPA